jgi:hypothetical protein
MKPLTIEQRVATLERELSELKAQQGQGRVKDWRRTIGIFTDNPEMKEVFAEAMKLREADRSKARRRQQAKRPAKSRSCSTPTISPC